MQWVKVDNTFFIECNAYGANNNKQLLHNENGRPSVLVAKLHYYKGLHDFIIPMKSNINASEGSENYFALPPNSRTKDGFHHIVSDHLKEQDTPLNRLALQMAEHHVERCANSNSFS